MEYKKIPLINDTFDPNSFIYIIRNNLLLYAILLVLAFVGGAIYLRYTPPLFQSISILQINKNDPERASIMEMSEVQEAFDMNNLTTLVELLRSPEFQKRILKRLPLGVNYYSQGTFLNYELYKNNPYFVEMQDVKDFFYENQIFIKFKDEKTYTISYTIGDRDFKYTFSTNCWNEINGCKLYVNVSNFQQIKEYQSEIGDKQYFFIPHSEAGSLEANMSGLTIQILSEQASTIRMDYACNNADKSADIVNALSEDFLSYNVEKKQERATKILQFIDEQLKIVYEQLDESERKLSSFKHENNINEDLMTLSGDKILSDDNGTHKVDELRKEYKALIQLQGQLQSNNQLNTAELLSVLNNSQSESMIINYLNAIGQLQSEKDKLLINVTENNQKIKVIDKQILSQKQLLRDFISISNEKLLAELSSLEKQKSNRRDTSRSKREFDEIELSKLMRIYKVNEGFYNQLVEKKAQYMIARAGHVSQNLILQKADVPDAPIYPIRSRILVIFFAIGVLIISVITAVKYLLHNEITTMSDVSKYTDAPIVGVIPNTRRAAKSDKRLLVENKANSIFTESFRTFRSNLEFLSTSKTSKVITVSSTISGEGKTFVALNLGGVLSFSGKKVLIIDMDLRRPKVHVNFKAENERGMSTLLIDRNTVDECVQHTEFPNYDFITAGPIPPNPSELATSDNFDRILEELKRRYDFIIIDTPPIGIVSDAIYSFQRSDYPIYVTRINYSKRNFIYNLNYIMDDKGIRNISIVLNGIELKTSGYGYSKGSQTYGYSYGYTYGYSYGYYGNSKDEDLKIGWLAKVMRYLNVFNYFNDKEV